MSHHGMIPIGNKRLPDSSCNSAMASFQIVAHRFRRAGSSIFANPWPPNPTAFGYTTCAQIPSSSMTSSRGFTSVAPGCASSSSSLKNSPEPWIFDPSFRMTLTANALPSTAPSTTQVGAPSTRSTRGTRSTYFAGAREVHRSRGSDKCVSTSITQTSGNSTLDRYTVPSRRFATKGSRRQAISFISPSTVELGGGDSGQAPRRVGADHGPVIWTIPSPGGEMLDHVIKGGSVVDGTGGPARAADIGIRGDRIVAVGEVDETARQTIDASGLVVAPGFIDPHTHYDAQLYWDGYGTPSNAHGVTSVIGGNCGFTLAPLKSRDADYTRRMMARVEGMPLKALESCVDWKWETFAEYLDGLEGRIGLNAGFMIGHCAIRRYVMGHEAVERVADAGEVDAMVSLLHQSIDAGGLGLSTTRSSTHSDGDGNPVPSRVASES